jgi:hypothetical protein
VVKKFIYKLFQNIFELIIKLIGFKSLCWIIATIALFINKATFIEWMTFTSVIIGGKIFERYKGMYPKLNIKGE